MLMVAAMIMAIVVMMVMMVMMMLMVLVRVLVTGERGSKVIRGTDYGNIHSHSHHY